MNDDTYDYVVDDAPLTGEYEITVVIPPGVPEEIKDQLYSHVLSMTYQDPFYGYPLGVCESPVDTEYNSLWDAEDAIENQRLTIIELQDEVRNERETNSALRAQLHHLAATLDAEVASRQTASGGIYPTTFPRTFTV